MLASSRTVLANASHEIRAPLHTILGMSELLTRTTLTPAQAQYLDALRRAATSLTSLLDSLLDTRRQREAPVRHERLWLPDIIEAAVATVRDRAASAGLELVVDVDTAVPRRLLGDAVRVQQVLTNLITNAVKYGERGTVTVRVSLQDKPNGGVAEASGHDDHHNTVQVALAVEDTGPGIAAAELDAIFVRGGRLARHINIEGSGLGLAITKRIVDDLGGRIDVSSRASGEVDVGAATGTVFRVVLPMLRAGSMESVDSAALAVRGVRFLVVGDDSLRSAVATALAAWSPFIDRVDLADATDRWQTHEKSGTPFHVVIVAGDDLAAIDLVRSDVAAGRVIAVLPSSALERLGTHIERASATPILLPITTGNLYGAVERVLHRLGQARDDVRSRDLDLKGAVVHAADDDPDARLLIELFVKGTGITLHLHATTAALINAVAADLSTTLVLCDVEMPDGGARVARAAIPLREGVSFVAITAHGDGVIDELHDEGFVEVARKPLTRRGLLDLIARRGVRSASLPSDSVRVSPPTTHMVQRSHSSDGVATSTKALSSPTPTDEALQLEARMALARRDYRALTLLGRRLSSPFKERLEVAAKAKNDAGVREVLRDLEQRRPPTDTVDDAIRALLPDYLQRRKSDAADIAEALDGGRFDHIAFVGHRLAGTARAFGMAGLSDVGAALERAGHHRNSDEVRRLLQRMHLLIAEVPE